MVDIFDAVADPTRRSILNALREKGPLSIKALAAPLPMSRQGVTKHLALLERSGLVGRRTQGRERIYYLQAEPLQAVGDWLAPYSAAWDQRLNRLKAHVDGGGDERADD